MDEAGPPGDLPEHEKDADRVAERRPEGVSAVTYANCALKLLENGYQPLPINPNSKRPAPTRWTTVEISDAQVAAWANLFPNHGIGLRTGQLVGVDIDILDAEIAYQVSTLAQQRLGDTLMRVGQWPKRLLLYRSDVPFAKLSTSGLEILGFGQQFVAFGIHPKTGQPYDWPLGDTPLDVPLGDLPAIDLTKAQAFVAEAAALIPGSHRPAKTRSAPVSAAGISQIPSRNEAGLVTDGRDAWLSTIAYHAVLDAKDAGQPLLPTDIALKAWNRFATTTDLSRPSSGSGQPYCLADAAKKVCDKLRLSADGRLAPRVLQYAKPVEMEPGLALDVARNRLDKVIADVCLRIGDWHEAGGDGDPPRFGIRATVGLGKTAVSRRHVLALMQRLNAASLPHRVLVFTPSHVLAEETAAAWRADGVTAAVHRGYEAKHPLHKAPMCKDIPMVHMAIASGLPVFPNSCLRRGGSKCHAFDACLKQENLNELAQADVVVAPYDTLFTGLSIASKDVALLAIDEGCWARALTDGRGLYVETLAHVGLSLEPKWDDSAAEEQAWQDLFALRSLSAKALTSNGPGPLARRNLVDVGLTAETCAKAAALETQLCPDPVLRPGLPQGARKRALELSQEASRSIRRQKLFGALAQLLHGEVEQDGRVRVLPPDAKTGLQEIVVTSLHGLDADFVGKPVLHLDATLRTELAATILPGLEVTEISAAMPHMVLTLVQGSFGKITLCHDPRAASVENQRRANRLRECVDYVRWQTKRISPGRVLVVTYKDCEAAYSGIPRVEVAHFNAIAGLDIYRDVALLIVIGRPLPPSGALHPMAGGYFSVEPGGTYEMVLRSVPMRDGTWRNIRVTQHEHPGAEILRAAICDDEVIQAIGRGRGVNRMDDTPLEVHVLADVALQLVHDRVLAWDAVAPDIVQRMLMAGMAVDSPADAAALHPDLFDGAEQARKACDRAGFNGQNPMYNTYREMSVKSARYRKGGRGSSWQRSFWVAGSADDARHRLESAIGPVADWKLLNG